MRTARCPHCDEEFETKYSWKIFCSRKCGQAHNWLTSTKLKQAARRAVERAKRKAWCRHCGKRFKPNRAYQIYCSPECRTEQDNRRKRDGRDPPVFLEMPCGVCGTVFRQGKVNQKYCGRQACRVEANRIRKKAARAAKRAARLARQPRPERGDDWVAEQLARLRT